ncbi:uncharacterized protein LOC135839589 isoform X3 [Planococcus citri]|uniref:uncharacterized protein LOC135839589 isoform X3 n=1 Tax=Planococcus citri TaxID=170843 RepID=UPI0031F9E681
MQFFFLVFFLCFKGSENYNNDSVTDFLQTLDTLSDDKRQRIETTLNCKIENIRNISAKGDPVRWISIATNLTSVLGELWSESIAERTRKKKLDGNTKILNATYIPSRFLCAWSSVLRFLDVISTQENLKVFTYSKKRIFQLADEAAKRDSIPRKGLRRLSKDEFIAVVKKLAPKLEDNMIQKVADHAVADYTFRGERIIYHEKVLAYFTGWINYLKNSARRLHSKLMMELKQPHLYNGTELGAEAQIFALIMARDHLLAHHVEKCFWQKYGMMILHGCDKQFDHILDSEYIGGWYYTEQSIRLVQLLVRAKELIELPRFHIPLEYERFSERPEVGMPQSSACRCSFAKNDIQYGMTTSLPPK